MIKSLGWIATWLAMTVLKKSLRNRLTGEGAKWLQPVTADKPKIFNRVDFIITNCRHQRILHIGFTDYPYTIEKIQNDSLLHQQLAKQCKALMGIDVQQEAIKEYTALTHDANVAYADITNGYPAAAIAFAPELILLTEVLEHLPDPYHTVNLLHSSFGHGTKLMVTVPNYTALDSLAASLHHTESIHPHHHWYFSPYTLQQLFNRQYFTMEALHFGMYYQPGSQVNAFLKHYPFNGDCIIAIFTVIKKSNND